MTTSADFVKTFLDPVHRDIPVRAEEARIIDTPTFQRLRHVKQLGTADLVFHGATHSRFSHSIGTMHVADQMASSINARVKIKGAGHQITPDERDLIRLTALLHDIGHAPFGHQLEDEYPVFPKHDEKERFESLLGPGTEIGRILGTERGKHIIELLSAEDGALEALPAPFVADIVGNTVCADLLDYARRDVHFTGLEKASGSRMLKYLFIPQSGPQTCRVVIDAWKNDHLRSDVISDILDLLDVRFALAERVLFHHSKLAAGAMLARALLESGIDLGFARNMGDDELLRAIGNQEVEVASRIIEKLARHEVYKAVWIGESNSVQRDTLVERYFELPSHEEADKVAARRRAREAKVHLEDRICSKADLPIGSVVIVCQAPKMLAKEADGRVRLGTQILPLRKYDQDPPRGAIEELDRRHRHLWRFRAYLDRTRFDAKKKAVHQALQLEIGELSTNVLAPVIETGRAA